MSEFNAKQARAKRPCPLWVDAFQRDTQHLEADEVGAYMLILMAMWTRETCDLPDDDRRLCRVARVSLRLWKTRVGPAIRDFLTSSDGVLISKRLREEATYVERQVKHQSDRKRGEKPDKILKTNVPPPTTDTTTEEPRNHPSQQPNNPTLGGGGSAREDRTFREKLLCAMGHDLTGLTASGKIVCDSTQMLEVKKWVSDLGLSEAEILRVVSETKCRDGPPSSPKFYTQAMQRRAGAKAEPKLKAINGGHNERPDQDTDRKRVDPALEQIARLTGVGGTSGNGGGRT